VPSRRIYERSKVYEGGEGIFSLERARATPYCEKNLPCN
jgi:hypothetical protein